VTLPCSYWGKTVSYFLTVPSPKPVFFFWSVRGTFRSCRPIGAAPFDRHTTNTTTPRGKKTLDLAPPPEVELRSFFSRVFSFAEPKGFSLRPSWESA